MTKWGGTKADWRKIGDNVFGAKPMTERTLIFSPITKKWEIGRLEENLSTGAMQWEREDGSWICAKGNEIAIAPLPPKPTK
jgi:hypothetical protein